MRGTEHRHHEGSFPSSSAASIFSSSISLALRGGRSVLSIRRNQVVSMENSQDNELHELDLFQTHVADHLLSLLQPAEMPTSEEEQRRRPRQQTQKRKNHGDQPLITIGFLRNLLDAFLSCDGEFRTLLHVLLGRNSTVAARAPADRLVSDHLDRCIKALDICNAVTESLDSLRHLQKHASIAGEALRDGKFLGEAQFSRARNALNKLLAVISEKPPAERAWSFGRSSRGSTVTSGSSASKQHPPQRTLSLVAWRNWSATKTLQAMMGNLHPPRGGEGSALALAVYTMSSILVFVMWALVAAFPSQERSPGPAFQSPPRQLPWAGPLTGLQERILEEWRKKEKKGAAATMPSGLLSEIQELERYGKNLVELGDTVNFPLEEQQKEEITAEAADMAELCQAMEEEVVVLQRLVREVFRDVIRSRAEVVEFTAHGNRASSSSSPSL